MTIVEEITQQLQNFFGFFASFTDIGEFFRVQWAGISGWFMAFFQQIGNLFS